LRAQEIVRSLSKTGAYGRKVQNERPAIFVLLHKGHQGAKDVTVVTVFTGTNDDTVKIAGTHKGFVIMHDAGAMILPGLPAQIAPVIFGSAIMDAQETRRASGFQMLR
jgi:hypothetical protein